MKKNNIIYIGALLLLAISCKQDVITLEEPVVPEDTSCASATAGSANFTKFVAIGNSFVAGVQAGALFTEGQNNSLAAILNKQFQCVGASADFKQPTIGASLGWNLFVTQPILTNPTSPVLGRMLLQYGTKADCATGKVSPTPTPQVYAAGNLEALPNPTANPAFLYTASKTALNNFSVPAITLGQALTPATGNFGDPNPVHGFSPFYARFASAPGTSTILTDAEAAQGTFDLVWLGLDDFFLYAAYGGDPNYAPLTNSATFAAQYGAVFAHPTFGLFTVNPNLKGVVGNFPDIFKMPHFTAVSYNPIPLDAATVTQLNAGFAGYNSALDGLIAYKAMFGISDDLAAQIATRKVTFEASCTNKILIKDESLTDLGPYFDGLKNNNVITATQRAQLAPYQQVRQTTPTDIIPLATGSVLGTTGTFGVNGVSEPLGDRWVIIPTERDQINAARLAFNATVKATADAFSTKLAFANVDAAFTTLGTNGAAVVNNVTITPNINPPTGIYSEDGVHPNSRGYAFISTVFINAINAKFGATIPVTNIAQYSATGLPIQ